MSDWRHVPDAPESVRYHGGYDPSDPPQEGVWCAKCEHWEDDCQCPEESADEKEFPAVGSGAATEHGCSVAAAETSADEKTK